MNITLFIDNEKEFAFIGCPNKETEQQLKALFAVALDLLVKKNNGKYLIQNDVTFDHLYSE